MPQYHKKWAKVHSIIYQRYFFVYWSIKSLHNFVYFIPITFSGFYTQKVFQNRSCHDPIEYSQIGSAKPFRSCLNPIGSVLAPFSFLNLYTFSIISYLCFIRINSFSLHISFWINSLFSRITKKINYLFLYWLNWIWLII